MSYSGKRLLQAGAHLVALSFLAFALSSLAPGDVLSESRLQPDSSLPALRAKLHLDRPWPERYILWAGGVLHGDFGTSLSYGMPVTSLLAPRVPRSLLVAIPAWAMSWVLGIALAAAGARVRSLSRILEGGAAMFTLVPDLLLASLLTWPLLLFFRLDPDSVWLPLLPVTLGLMPVVFWHTSGALAGARESRYVRLASRAEVPEATILRKYLMPALANPLLALLGPTLVAAFGSTLTVEAVTGWPGAGSLFLEAFHSRDYPVTQAVLLLLGSLLTLANLLADLLLFRHDPRIAVMGDGEPYE